ncbi:hypothetical protein ACIQTN_33960 [Streptomyces werraensis]|uniref:hypothetical protein n=1 Tax=Streptomyces werraensis TaxID=68284 RepID=UPI0037F5FBE2
MPGRPLTRARRREINRQRHYEQRAERTTATGSKGIALAWSEQVRQTARERARYGDPGGWAMLAQTLELFCARHPAAADDRRAARQLYHWTLRLDGLTGADPKTLAAAWWDRARSVAASQTGDEGWNDLGRTLCNLAGDSRFTGQPGHGQ